MVKRHNITADGEPEPIICKHCESPNPPTAYCCIHCFKVLKETVKIPLWRVEFHPGAGAVVVVVIMTAGLVFAVQTWMETLNAEVSLHFASPDQSVSVLAKRKPKSQPGLPVVEREKPSSPLPDVLDSPEPPASTPPVRTNRSEPTPPVADELRPAP